MASTLKQTTPKQHNLTEVKLEEVDLRLGKLATAEKTATSTSAAESFANDVRWNHFMRADTEDRLDKIIGIFKDEPLMEDLMERIREDRRREIETSELE